MGEWVWRAATPTFHAWGPVAHRGKLLLGVHLTVAGGWIGRVVAYLALGAVAATSSDPQAIRGCVRLRLV